MTISNTLHNLIINYIFLAKVINIGHIFINFTIIIRDIEGDY